MNLEQSQRVKEAKKQRTVQEFEHKQNEELETKKKRITERAQALKTMDTYQMFADLLDGREDICKKCREFLILNVLAKNVGTNAVFNGDFAFGYRTALESFEAFMGDYKRAQEVIRLTEGDN